MNTGKQGTRKIELLAPANLEKAKTAIRYGADAVYIGGNRFSLRSRASNFSMEDIQELCQFAKEFGAKSMSRSTCSHTLMILKD